MIGILVAIVVVLQAPQPPAAQHCKTVKGRFLAHKVQDPLHPESPMATAGELTGGLQGSYTFYSTSAAPAGAGAPPSVIFFVGQSTVTLKKGGTLIGIDAGAIDMPPGQGGFASLITWKSGATGQLRLRGVLTPATGTTTGEYQGTICGAPNRPPTP